MFRYNSHIMNSATFPIFSSPTSLRTFEYPELSGADLYPNVFSNPLLLSSSGSSESLHLNIEPIASATTCLACILPSRYQWPKVLDTALAPTTTVGIIFFILEIVLTLLTRRGRCFRDGGSANVFGYPIPPNSLAAAVFLSKEKK